MKKNFEVEQKYRVKNPAVIRKQFRALGAKKISSGREVNELLDCGTLVRSRKAVLRLRFSGGKGRLTLKGPRMPGRFKQRLEIETVVEHEKMRLILEHLNFKPVAFYEKTREEYVLGKAHLTLDCLKGFGWFTEIEASAREIHRLEKTLGFTKEDREERTYLEMIYGTRSPWRG